MRLRTLAPLAAIAALTLAGCSSSNDVTEDTSQDTPETSANATTPETSEESSWSTDQTFYAEYAGSVEAVHLNAETPADIAEGMAIHQYSGTPNFISIDVDNTSGTEKVGFYQIDVVDMEGNTTSYESAFAWFGDLGDGPGERGTMDLTPEEDGAVTDTYNNYLNTDALPRAKSTELLVSEDPLPDEVAAIYLQPTGMGPMVTAVPESEKDNYWQYTSDSSY